MAQQKGFAAVKSMILKQKGHAVEMPDTAGVQAAHQARMAGAKNRRGGGGRHGVASEQLNQYLKGL